MDMNERRSTYELYMVAWSAVDDDERHRILTATVTNGVAYLDANLLGTSLEALATHLAGFQQARPGFSFGLAKLLVYQDVGLANWNMIDPMGAVVMSGFDAVRFDDDGRMSHITGFSDAPHQQAL